MISLYIYSNCILYIVWLVILCINVYEPKDFIGLNMYVRFVIGTAGVNWLHFAIQV